MRSRACLCGALLGALALAATAQQETPLRWPLVWRYQLGQELRYELVEERYQGAQQEVLLSIAATVVSMQVVEVRPEGGARLSVTLRRYRFEDELEQLDSRKLPADFDRSRSPALSLMGQRFGITTGPRGGITELEGAEAIAEQLRAEAEAQRRAQRRAQQRAREATGGEEPPEDLSEEHGRLEEQRLETLLQGHLNPANLARLCPQSHAQPSGEQVAGGASWSLVGTDEDGVATISVTSGSTDAGTLTFHTARGLLLRGEVETRLVTPLGVQLIRRTHELLEDGDGTREPEGDHTGR